MHRIILALAALSCIALLVRPGDVRAGTAVRLDVSGLVDHADLVVEARVIASRTLLVASGRIETEYTLDVKRAFLGDAQLAHTIRLPGGVLPASQGGRGLLIPGMPSLGDGENVVLFLTGAGASGMRMPVGLAQGKYRIVADALGRRFALQSLNALSLVDAQGAPTAAVADSVEFDVLATQIEAAVQARRARESLQNAAAPGKGR